MDKLRLALFSLTMVLAASLALSCGASSNSNTTGQLQSITISPPTAAAVLPGQQVQFTATGHYNTPPLTITPQPAKWGACYQNASTTAVSVTSTGLAQCVDAPDDPGVEYSIFAFVETNCTVLTVCGGGCTIVGTAQLSCSGNQVIATVRRTAPNPHLPGEQY
ncbi:MAG: hypothetical protein WB683_18685 [Candidatus Sulfotelmatobacter sp.]